MLKILKMCKLGVSMCEKGMCILNESYIDVWEMYNDAK